ncbi:zinc-dependent peptidase [Flavobacterium sp. SM2513]|uniref:zinc-dependent peptidase n=1 Tax=Flavobacterium sp. SM2513 TaxID=3424766 RepID=UPI003D7FED20
MIDLELFEFIMIGLGITFIVLTILVLFKLVAEPIYILIYKKPIYVHYYPFSRKVTASQQAILRKEFSFYSRLSKKRKEYFDHRVSTFLSRYKFVGNGISVENDDVRMIVAGTYVMLTFGMRQYLTSVFDKIILYPSVYYSTVNEQYHKGEFNPHMKAVVFSWNDFLSGHQITNNNINLGLHEFTHALHIGSKKRHYSSDVIFIDEFNAILEYLEDADFRQKMLNDDYFRDYAYENQFEFLAVLLEHFFETPEEFNRIYPKLFSHVKRMINFQN